jgi:hypothetical protein
MYLLAMYVPGRHVDIKVSEVFIFPVSLTRRHSCGPIHVKMIVLCDRKSDLLRCYGNATRRYEQRSSSTTCMSRGNNGHASYFLLLLPLLGAV